MFRTNNIYSKGIERLENAIVGGRAEQRHVRKIVRRRRIHQNNIDLEGRKSVGRLSLVREPAMQLQAANFCLFEKRFDLVRRSFSEIHARDQQRFTGVQTRSIQTGDERPIRTIFSPKILDRNAMIRVVVRRTEAIQH